MTNCPNCKWKGDPKDCERKLAPDWIYTGNRYLACPDCGKEVVSSQVWDKSIQKWVAR